MAIPVTSDLDFGTGFQLISALIDNRTTDPAAPKLGQFWIRGGVVYYFDGVATKALATGTGGGLGSSDAATLGGHDASYYLNRGNHTGTQAAATISDFDAQVRLSRLDQMALPTAPVSLGTQRLTNVAPPQNADDAATKGYVDVALQGLDPKASVRAATTAAGTLATSFVSGSVVDGVTLVTLDRILLKNQAAPEENGIYVVNASGAPTRALDFNAWAEMPGAFTFVEEGTANRGSGWVCTVAVGGTLGVTAISFTQFSGAGSYAGTNLPGSYQLYSGMSGNLLQFRTLTAGSTKISLTQNVNDVAIDVDPASISLDTLSNVLITSKAAGDILAWDGTHWLNNTLVQAGIQPALGFTPASNAHAATHAPGGADALPWTTIHGRGPTASKPAASAANAGFIYFDTDLGKQQRSNGTTWEDCEGAGGVSGGGATGYPSFPIDTPPATPNTFDDEFNGSTLNAAWTKVDANNTISVANGKLLLSGTGAVGATIKKSITRPFCIIAKFTQAGLVSPSYACIFLNHGATNGNYYSVGLQGRATAQNNALSIQSQRVNSAGTWVSEILWPACPHATIYVKIEDNGTTLTQSLSSDGIVWQIIRSEPYNTWCVVDWVGIGSSGSNGYPFAFYCDWIRRIY